MNESSTASDSPAAAEGVLAIDGDLTVVHAAHWREQMLAALQEGVKRFDLRGITDLDTAGVQLLLSARATAAQRQQALQLQVDPQGPVPEVLSRYGLATLLEPDAEAAR